MRGAAGGTEAVKHEAAILGPRGWPAGTSAAAAGVCGWSGSAITREGEEAEGPGTRAAVCVLPWLILSGHRRLRAACSAAVVAPPTRCPMRPSHGRATL